MAELEKYREYFADCYVMTSLRKKAFIYSFLDAFLPYRKESADEYGIPQYSERPIRIYHTAEKLIDFLVDYKDERYAIYWTNKEMNDIQNGMCFFIDNGQLVIGLSCKTRYPDTTVEDYLLAELLKFCNSNQGYIAYEEPAILDTTTFIDRVKNFSKTQQK